MAKGFLNRDNEDFVSGNWPVPLALTFLESLTATIRSYRIQLSLQGNAYFSAPFISQRGAPRDDSPTGIQPSKPERQPEPSSPPRAFEFRALARAARRCAESHSEFRRMTARRWQGPTSDGPSLQPLQQHSRPWFTPASFERPRLGPRIAAPGPFKPQTSGWARLSGPEIRGSIGLQMNRRSADSDGALGRAYVSVVGLLACQAPGLRQ